MLVAVQHIAVHTGSGHAHPDDAIEVAELKTSARNQIVNETFDSTTNLCRNTEQFF